MKHELYMSLIVLFLLIGCSTTQTTEPKQTEDLPPMIPDPLIGTLPLLPTTTTNQSVEPSADKPEEPTKPEEPEEPTEYIETHNYSIEEPTQKDTDFNNLLEKARTKLKSYSYSYKAPGATLHHKIYVKDNKIRITLPEFVSTKDDEHYDTIYLDTKDKKAEAYCIDCRHLQLENQKAKDLDYDESYIDTVIDWLAKVNETNKIGGLTIESRESSIFQTNIGEITVEHYYGFLYQIKQGDKVWEFSQAEFNTLSDAEVNLP